MPVQLRRRDGAWLRRAAAAALVSMLCACGGGGGGGGGSDTPPPASGPVAVADAYTLAWNASASLGVTDNDTLGGGGSATVAVDVAPKHGTATVSGSKINYTPNAGFFGPDSFSYKLSVGTASQSATVKLTVEAALTLHGQVGSTPIANATVKAGVGSQSFTATADAGGRYSLAVKTADAGDFLALTATGAGAQSKLVLTSLVGETGALAAATKDGKLSADQSAALNISHLSAAQAGLIAQAGSLPRSGAELAAALGRLTPQPTQDAAAVVKLVVDGGVALPAGAGDTRALLSSATQLSALLANLQQSKPVELEAARQATLGDPSLGLPPPTPAAGGAPLTLIYCYGDESGVQGVRVLTLSADGTGTEIHDRARPVHWSVSGRALQFTYDEPITENFQDVDRAFLGQLEITEGVPFQLVRTGMAFSDFGGTPGAALAKVTRQARVVLQPPGQPTSQRLVSSSEVMRRQIDTLPLKAEDLAAITHLAGLVAPTRDPWLDSVDANGFMESHQDIAAFTSPTELTLSRTGLKASWRLVDGKLRIDYAGGISHLYASLGKGVRGDSRWLLQTLANGSPQTALELSVIPVAIPTLDRSFWQHSFASNNGASYSPGVYYRLRSDGGFGLRIISAGLAATDYDYSRREWRLLANGQVEAVRTYSSGCSFYQPLPGQGTCAISQKRAWQPLMRVGDTVWVMQQGPVLFDQAGRTSSGDYRSQLLALTLQGD